MFQKKLNVLFYVFTVRLAVVLSLGFAVGFPSSSIAQQPSESTNSAPTDSVPIEPTPADPAPTNSIPISPALDLKPIDTKPADPVPNNSIDPIPSTLQRNEKESASTKESKNKTQNENDATSSQNRPSRIAPTTSPIKDLAPQPTPEKIMDSNIDQSPTPDANQTASPPSPVDLRIQALQLESTDAVVFFNQALTFIKEQKLGLALAYLREAQLLAPRHSGTQQALHYLEQQMKSRGIEKENPWLSFSRSPFVQFFKLPEILTFHWLFSFLTLFFLSQLFRARRRAGTQNLPPPPWRVPHYLLSGLWILTSLVLVWKISLSLPQSATVITSGSLPLRSGPLTEAAQLMELPEGTLVFVKDYYKEWVQVRSPQSPMGWVPRQELLLLTPEGFR